MKRRLVSILSALSLVLCVEFCVLWVRSYRVIDRVSFGSGRLYRAVSGGGGVFVESLRLYRHKRSWRGTAVPPTRTTMDYAEWRSRLWGRVEPGSGLWQWDVRPYGRATLMTDAWGPDVNRALPDLTWIAIARMNSFNNVDGTMVSDSLYGPRVWVPYWLIVAVTAALPAWRLFIRARRSRRASRDLCPACGYDLRATPDKCPECGEVRANAHESTAARNADTISAPPPTSAPDAACNPRRPHASHST